MLANLLITSILNRNLPDNQFVNPRTIHINDLNLKIQPMELLTGRRNTPQFIQYQSSDGRKI